MVARQALAGLLIALLAFPAWSNPLVVGTVAATQSAQVRGNALVAGSTVFSGDVIQVGADGSASIAGSNGVQIRIGPKSLVRLSLEKEKTLLEIGQGSASFRVEESIPFEARLADATIRGAGKGPAVGVVILRGLKTAVVAAEKGELAVSTAHDGKMISLKEGEGVEVSLAPPPQGGGGTTVTTLSGKWVAILGIITVGAITAIAIFRNSADKGMTDRQRGSTVSPFRFP